MDLWLRQKIDQTLVDVLQMLMLMLMLMLVVVSLRRGKTKEVTYLMSLSEKVR